MAEAYSRRRAIHQVLLATLWLTLLIFAVKVWAGWAAKSLSLLAESVHTLINGFSTLLSLLAVTSPHRTSGREVWGHGRLESIGALFLVALLGFSSLSLLGGALKQLEASTRNAAVPFEVSINLPLIQLLGVAIAIGICLAFFERYEARVLESAALRLNANHILQDAWLSVVVLIGLVGVWRGYVWLDPLLAIIVIFVAIRSCWRVLNWQLPLLVRQVAIAPEILAQLARQVEGVTHCYRIQSRGIVGRQVFVEMYLVLHPEFLGAARVIAERVEGTIRERYGPVQTIIHIDTDQSSAENPYDSLGANNTNDKPR
ncbi:MULTISPECIES: cation diffusion facilitator family transporter [Trichocoleus]|uniref:Cation diffusion facilitator family transporter n=1 Tax=Trichocoleus desertorum GB2-A4 TaxID=2933944 RepID=A0ABV0J7G4_9CYAN|nr:cation diffusion facilitator family transporter [Trichocoleus sp. FACHB-46]MBD1863817.1 cation diffusion facilitator family transporter [Trichocoleus sp. FACHB-46]